MEKQPETKSKLIEKMEEYGWSHVQISDTEGEWMKFDENGNPLARQGDEVWEHDLRQAKLHE